MPSREVNTNNQTNISWSPLCRGQIGQLILIHVCLKIVLWWSNLKNTVMSTMLGNTFPVKMVTTSYKRKPASFV